MKCFTYDESQKWLASMHVRIDENRNLWFSSEQEKIMTTMPRGAAALNRLSAELAQWLSCHSSRMLWLSNWQTDPAHPLILFEKIRIGCGELRHIIEAPGHLFEESNENESAILTGLMFLIMAFDWEAYVVTQNHGEFVYLGDEHIVYSSADGEKMKEVSSLNATFGLKKIEDIREAWK
jgi:hypothetical protein